MSPLSSVECGASGPGFSVGRILLGGFLVAVLVCGAGVASFFHLSADTAALETSVIHSVPVRCDKKIALHAGFLTAGLARTVSRFLDLPPEAHAAFEAFRGAEVAIYDVQSGFVDTNPAAVMAAADKTMVARGWSRLAGVVDEGQLVCVYLPAKRVSSSRMRCSVLVLNREQLVLVSARADLDPLLDIARRELKSNLDLDRLALR